MLILDDILLAPLNGTVWLGQRLLEAAEDELFDEGKLKAGLLDAQERWLLGDLSDDAYRLEEDRLLALLEEASRRKAGGPARGRPC